MSPKAEARARRWYRVLLRAYPPPFRRRYGEEMEHCFIWLLRRDVARAGAVGALRCWLGTLWDCGLGGVAARLGRGEEERSIHGGWGMGMLGSDLRLALRALWRRPVFGATAVLTIALGIGANASVFTVVKSFLFAPLPYERPDELVILWDENPDLGWSDTDISPANAWDWRERARSVADLAVHYEERFTHTSEGQPELVAGLRVTPNYLTVLGRAPALGRDLRAAEVGEGIEGVAILMDGFWERRFGRAPEALGSTLLLDGHPYTVVGIMPRDFVALDARPDVLVPHDLHPRDADRSGHYAEAIARLAPGATVAGAQRELAEVARELEVEHPDTNEGWTVKAVSARADLVGDIAHQASLVLMVAVGFVLLMACVNVANLLLARAGSRGREMAVRSALGAGRGQVIRQLLTESFLMAGLGGVLGLGMGWYGYRGIVAALPSTMPPVFEFGMDGPVVAYTVLLTAAAAIFFGTVPAVRTSRYGAEMLRDGGRSGRSARAGRFGSTLVVVQTAVAVVLLVGGGLLMRSIAGMRSQDFGFDTGNLLITRISPPADPYDDSEALGAFWDAVETRVRELPGVTAAGTTQAHPLGGSNWGWSFTIAGREGEGERTARVTYASEDLFETLGFRTTSGRPLSGADGPEDPPVAVVNETFVSRYLGGQDPLTAGIVADEGEDPVRIVGVVHDVVERSVEGRPEPAVYVSLAQRVVRSRSLLVRTVGEPSAILPDVQRAVWSVDPTLPVYGVDTMDELVRRRLGGFAVIGYLMGIFALLSLLLGAVGIYGVTAYAAGQRTAELGLRIAMGADPSDVVRMMLLQGGRRALLGLVAGLILAGLLSGAMTRILVGVSPRDPLTFASVALVLAAVSLLGLYLPARRAARVDPVRALAAE